jgi:tetratricopeptide (TPR) repeat protein
MAPHSALWMCESPDVRRVKETGDADGPWTGLQCHPLIPVAALSDSQDGWGSSIERWCFTQLYASQCTMILIITPQVELPLRRSGRSLSSRPENSNRPTGRNSSVNYGRYQLYREQGNYEKAVELQEKCLRINKQQLGETHPETLIAKVNLAWTYRLQERFAEAQPIQEELLAISIEFLGESHPHTLVTMDRLASTLEAQERFAEAEELQIMCVVGVKKRLGLDHVDTAMATYNPAVNYYVTRRFDHARDLARETERIQRQGLGKDHPHYQLTVQLLGDIEDGRLQDAVLGVKS